MAKTGDVIFGFAIERAAGSFSFSIRISGLEQGA